MVQDAPEVVSSRRYTTTEAAQLLGIHRNTLNRYTAQGRIRCIHLSMNGKRFYLGSEIARCYRETV